MQKVDIDQTKAVKVKETFTYVLPRPLKGGRLPKKMVQFGDRAGTTTRFVVAGLNAVGVRSGRVRDVRYEVGVHRPRPKAAKKPKK